MDRALTRLSLRFMEQRLPFVRATVVRTVGSVPAKEGATMLRTPTGDCFGTVGGAALEERVKEASARALETHRGELLHFDLQAWKEGGLPSLCGGSVDIALEYVAARPSLLLWGGGHVAQAIARLLPGLEYDHTVADDRPEWVTVDRFPDAERREVVSAEYLWERVSPSAFSHLYVLGYDAKKDTEVLYRALEQFPGVIGLIASSAKRAHIFAELRRRGVDELHCARIRSPIGVPVGAETPAEIAVSVLAEVIRDAHAEGARRANVDEPLVEGARGIETP
ncbi:MAG: XdhC/CoxI family protein [Thermoplasmata archaeon]|nr:XdhC/CoxI family protein [Thermoplasmata archaeon]